MPAVAPSPVASSLELLRETFEGPAGPSTYFIDNGPKAGFFGGRVGGRVPTRAARQTGGPSPGGRTRGWPDQGPPT